MKTLQLLFPVILVVAVCSNNSSALQILQEPSTAIETLQRNAERGNVSDIRVSKGHPLLDEAAVNAVGQWKFSPMLLNGEPVPVIASVTVFFNLR